MGSVIIDKVTTSNVKNDVPLILRFPGSLKTYENKNASAVRLSSSKKDANERISAPILLATDDQMYKGTIDDSAKEVMNTFIAIRNKRTGKMRCIQVNECKLSNMNESRQIFSKMDTYTGMRKFGSKIEVKALEAMEEAKNISERIQEKADAIVEAYEAKSVNIDEHSKVKAEGEIILQSLKPPRNIKAESIQEIYLLDNLLPYDIQLAMEKAILELVHRDAETVALANDYLTLKYKMGMQSKEPDSKENMKTYKICLFMDALYRLLKFRGTKLGSAKPSVFSSDLGEFVKLHFSQINHHEQINTKYSFDKAMLHYLALAFILEDGSFQLDVIHASLPISKGELIRYAGFIGGHYDSRRNVMALKMQIKSAKRFGSSQANYRKKKA